MNIQLISINPWFYTNSGHHHIYLQSIESACKALNWDFLALVPEKNIVESLPKNWIKCMNCPTVRHWHELIENAPYKRPRKLIRAQMRIKYYLSLFKNLRNKLIRGTNILFFETFSLSDIKLTANLINLLPKKTIQVWLIFRYPSSFLNEEISSYKKIFEQILSLKIPLKLITDSELLASDLTETFKKKFHLFPIPHVEDFTYQDKKTHSLINCWWPGLARPSKGQAIIEAFAKSQHPSNSDIHLICSEDLKLVTHENGPQINLLPSHLSRNEYIQQLMNSDVILLPYIDKVYEKTTSGIFTESIMAEKMTLVYPGTWMAYELKRFSLDEFIIDWNPESLADRIIALQNNPTLKEKLKFMKNEYKKFHSGKMLAEEMQKTLTSS